MAPQGSMKRPAAAAGTGRPAKRTNPVASKCRGISDAIKGSSLPDHVRLMLAEAVGSCLQTYKQDRHEYQTKLIDMVAQVMAELEDSGKSAVSRAETIVAGSAHDKDARQAAMDAARSKLQACQTDLEQKQDAHAADIETVKSLDAGIALADKQAKAADKAIEELIAKKDKLEAVFAGDAFGQLKEAAGSSAVIKNLVKVCLDSGFEKPLLETVPSVLQKAPDARGTFGSLIVDQLQGHFTQHVDSFTQSLNEMTSRKAELAAKDAQTHEELQSAKDKKDASAAAVGTARASVNDAKAAVVVAQKAVNEFAPERERASKELTVATLKLKALEDGPLADFAALLEHAPPKEAVVVGEAAAVEEQEVKGAEESGAEPMKVDA